MYDKKMLSQEECKEVFETIENIVAETGTVQRYGIVDGLQYNLLSLSDLAQISGPTNQADGPIAKLTITKKSTDYTERGFVQDYTPLELVNKIKDGDKTVKLFWLVDELLKYAKSDHHETKDVDGKEIMVHYQLYGSSYPNTDFAIIKTPRGQLQIKKDTKWMDWDNMYKPLDPKFLLYVERTLDEEITKLAVGKK